MNGQSYNRYSYVLNNPTNLTDPTGFESAPVHRDAVIRESGSICNKVDTCTVHNISESSNGTAAKKTENTQNPQNGGNRSPSSSDSANSDKPLQAAGCGQCNRFPDKKNETSEPEQPGLVEKHVKDNPCLYTKCNPWQQAQAAFTGTHTMVGEAWVKFTGTVGSVLPLGGGGPVVVEKGVVPIFSNGMSITQVGEKVIGWSKGPKGATEALSNMTPQRAREVLQQISPAETAAIRDFYRQTEKYLMVNNPAALKATPTPTLRAELAEKILKHGGK